jgi:SecD/SecF fusion protein
MGAHGAQGAKWLQIDFMRRRYLWFAISGTFVLICAVSLGLRGLNLGIDFKGGTQITFATTKPHSVQDIRTIAGGHAVIQGRGSQFAGGTYKSFQIRERSLKGAEQASLTTALTRQADATKLGVQNVSSSFGRQIARDAILAIIFSLFLIVIYMAIRFDSKFAVPVIIAMIHDVFIATGVYSLTGREVTTSTVAAILTVLGYSIYDTIIIFDRIRENIPIMRRSSFATITNVSLWETIRRSIATTVITLLPVGALFIFGGATLQDFAFALLVGVTSGAYSSIFIAAPLLAIWKEREPEYAKKRHLDAASRDGQADATLEAAESAAAAAPAPELAPIAAVERAAADIKRERRRQRRRARPHGRAR